METWTKAQTLILINEFKKYELLYKFTHPDHLNTYKKNIAIDKIVEVVKNYKNNLSINDVKRKIKVLKQQVAQEQKKMKRCNGIGTDEVYVPSLWCFDELSFLINVNNEVGSASNADFLEMSSSICIEETGSDCSTQAPSCNGSANKQKRPYAELETAATKSINLMERMASNLKENKEDLFCRMICEEIKSFKFEESYYKFTSGIYSFLIQLKAEEKQKLETLHASTPTSSSTSKYSSSMPSPPITENPPAHITVPPHTNILDEAMKSFHD